MKKTTLIFLLTFFVLYSYAQAPEWQWAIQAGGNDWDYGYSITLDEIGNSYITGVFSETAIFGSTSLISSGEYDVYVAKMDAIGNWQWAAQAGGINDDYGLSIILDELGNSYVTGHFMDTSTFGTISLTSSGENDIFVAKLDLNGNWEWATKAGGSNYDQGLTIALDEVGNSYVTGLFSDTATFGSTSLIGNGDSDIFVAKLDTSGNWQWVTQAGGSSTDRGYSIILDNMGNSYISGIFSETASFGTTSLTSSGYCDIFVAKLDISGNWQWINQAGGSNYDYGVSIILDETGNSYVTGMFGSTAIFGSTSLTSSGYWDIFVTKLDSDGNWEWATKAGGSASDRGYKIILDETGNPYVTGYFEDTAIFGTTSLTSNGYMDIFVSKLDASGNWEWVTQAGGNNEDLGFSITIDETGNSYVTGMFNETITFGSTSLPSSGGFDIFIAKLGNDTVVENDIISTKMELSNYPNPFNPSTTIEFSILHDSNIELSIYNIKGQKVKTIANNEFETGNHSIIWNADDEFGEPVSSGIYYYKLIVDEKTEVVKKCLLLK